MRILRASALNSFPEEKSLAEKASKKIELEVNPNSIFVFGKAIPPGLLGRLKHDINSVVEDLIF